MSIDLFASCIRAVPGDPDKKRPRGNPIGDPWFVQFGYFMNNRAIYAHAKPSKLVSIDLVGSYEPLDGEQEGAWLFPTTLDLSSAKKFRDMLDAAIEEAEKMPQSIDV